jgi:hypothetical protein
MKDDFWSRVCANYQNDKITNDHINIGYFDIKWPFIVIPSLALILNLIALTTGLYKNIKNK